jgi:Fe-S cluster assembly protein SufD
MKQASATADGALDYFLGEAARHDRERSAADPGWLRTTRRKAAMRFAETGFPAPRDEEWRFTNVAPIVQTAYVAARAEDVASQLAAIRPLMTPARAAVRLVFVNGRYAPALSALMKLPSGVRVGSLAAAVADRPDTLGFLLARAARTEDRGFAALNTAFLHDGALVEIPANLVLDVPIHLLFVSLAPGGPSISHPRVLIVAGEHSQAAVVERYAAPGHARYLSNAVTEISVGAGAVVEYYRIQQDAGQAFHIGTTQATVERGGTLTSHAVTLGAAISRSDINVTLAGEGASCTLNGLYVADGDQSTDHHTVIVHAQPHGSSRELYKGIVDGQAHAAFSGRIVVRPDAQKTDAKQTNKTLLLSDAARISTKPQLEIFANDVKCTHGATVGQLNEDQLFYLRTRGIGQGEARTLLIQAFAGDVLDRMALVDVREPLDALLRARLGKTETLEVPS